MTRARAFAGIGFSAMMLLGAIGCEEKTEPVITRDDSALEAERRMADLQAQLSQARADRAASQDEIVRLQNELNKLREQLAQRRETPSPAAGWSSVPGGAMTSIEGTILFDSGKATLKTTARRTLNEVARVISEKFPGHDIYVFGHTDDTPIKVSGWKDNYELSCQRALSVVRFLQSAGVDQNMAAAGWGDRRPVSENTSAQARQANRRVEIFAMAPQTNSVGLIRTAPPSPEQ